MVSPKKPPHHVGAHSSKTNHSDLHDVIPFLELYWSARRRPALRFSIPAVILGRLQRRLTLVLERRIPSRGTRLLLEGFHKFEVAAGNVVHGVFPRDLLCSPVYERIPKTCTAHCEADEPRDSRCRRQPLTYPLVVLAAPQDDAADFVAVA